VLPALLLSAALLAQDSAAAPAQAGAAVSVDAYRRDYEGPKTDAELRFDTSIWSAYNSKENQIGAMEGSWVVADATGRKLVGLELRNDNLVSGRLEGAWRSMLAGFGLNNSGFVSDVSLTGNNLEVNYFPGKSRSPTILQMRRDTTGAWRGSMLDATGKKTVIVMTRVAGGD
jgi:hypothetical protein